MRPTEPTLVRRARLTVALLWLLALAACASVEAPGASGAQPQEARLTLASMRRPVVALVLSGGSARGFAHIGVLRVLEEQGFEPDFLVGSSAGAIVAVAHASGLSAQQLSDKAEALAASTFTDFTLPDLGLPMLRGELGFVRGERLQRWVDQITGGRLLEALPRRVAVVATDLQSGLPVAFTRGAAGLAVRASAAVPGVFVPPLINGRHYVDGQVSSPVPVTLARALGADVVIAVDATFPPEHAEIANTLSVLFQSFTIATQRVKSHELTQADLVITPQIRTASQLSLADRGWLMQAGEQAAREALPRLRALLPGRLEPGLPPRASPEAPIAADHSMQECPPCAYCYMAAGAVPHPLRERAPQTHAVAWQELNVPLWTAQGFGAERCVAGRGAVPLRIALCRWAT